MGQGDPGGLTLQADHCVLFFSSVYFPCLQITQCENGAEEAQRSGQHTSGPLEGETPVDAYKVVLRGPLPTKTPQRSSVSMLTCSFLRLCVSKQPEQVLKQR